MTLKIFTIASVPGDLQQKWLQHLRDFDVEHPGCHFEVAIDAPPDMPLAEIIQKMVLEPALTFQKIFTRGESKWRRRHQIRLTSMLAQRYACGE